MRENFRRDDIKFFKALIEHGGGGERYVFGSEIWKTTDLTWQRIGGIAQRWGVYVEKQRDKKTQRMKYRLTRQGVEQMIKQGWVIVVPVG